MSDVSCNLCGSVEFGAMNTRPGVRCMRCNSVERTRALGLFLAKLDVPRPGMRVLHLAPERGLAEYFTARVGAENYRACDLEPARYPFCKVERLDLCADAESLPSNHYHLVVHVHVLEHVPCNYTAVLSHLHRALHPDGLHIMCIPFLAGSFDESWGPLSSEERIRRFGQDDHVRRFGAQDAQATLGALFDLPRAYDLEREFGVEALERHRIPKYARTGLSANTIMIARKNDWKLRTG